MSLVYRRWRISVDDGVTLAFGNVVDNFWGPAILRPALLAPPAPPEAEAAAFSLAPLPRSAPLFVPVGWALALAGLRNPSDVLSSEQLCAVFGALSVRDRLACASVCRAWRRELAPAAAARNAAAGARNDMSLDSFPRRLRTLNAAALRALLVATVLPRFGAHVRELSLRGTAVDDETLALVLAACPRLNFLDVRDCRGALAWSEAGDYGFLHLLLTQYERAAPQQRFTLLMYGSGIRSCRDCPRFCPNAQRVVLPSLQLALVLPIKPPLPGSRQETAPHTGAWLRCDTALCPLRDSDSGYAGELACNMLMRVVLPETRRPGEVPFACDICARNVCEGVKCIVAWVGVHARMVLAALSSAV
jgi:hypothetical protein